MAGPFDTLIDIIRDVWTGYTGTGKLRVDASGSTFTGTVTGDQGAPNTVGNAWPVKVTDGVETAEVTVANALKTDSSATVQPISAASLPLPSGAATQTTLAAAAASLVAIDAGIPAALGQTTMANSMPVVLASDQSDLHLGAQTIQTASGTLTAAGQEVSLTFTQAWSAATFEVIGPYVGAVQFYYQKDGTNWRTLSVLSVATGAYTSIFTNGTGLFHANVSGLLKIKVVMASYTSGSAAIEVSTSQGSQIVEVRSSPGLLNATVTGTVTTLQGTTPWLERSQASYTIDTLNSLNDTIATPDPADFGNQTVSVEISGTWVGEISFGGTVDGISTPVPLAAIQAPNGDAAISTTTNGQFFINTGGVRVVYIVMTSYTSGSATVALGYNAEARFQEVINLNADNFQTTCNAGNDLNTSALALEAGGNLESAAISLAIIDGWDESDRAKVNPIVGQAGVQGASGVVTALTQRVVLATDVTLPATPKATTGTPSGITVSTSAVIIKASNAARRAIVITNNSTGFLYLGTSAGVTTSGATMGNIIYPGGTYSDSGDGLYTGDLYGIYSQVAASQNISVSERT